MTWLVVVEALPVGGYKGQGFNGGESRAVFNSGELRVEVLDPWLCGEILIFVFRMACRWLLVGKLYIQSKLLLAAVVDVGKTRISR